MPPSPIGKTSTSPRRRVAVLVVALIGGAYPVGPDARGPGRVGRARSHRRGFCTSRISLILVYAPGVLEPFQLVFVQRGVLEVAALAIGAGLVGTWIVLRGLAFYAHAVGSAAFPGLVLADGLGFSAHLGARRDRARRRRHGRLAGPARPRALRQRDRPRPRGRAGRGRAPGQRRLPLRRARRDAALRQPARHLPRRRVVRGRRERRRPGRLCAPRPPLAGDRLRPRRGARARRPLRACPTRRCSSSSRSWPSPRSRPWAPSSPPRCSSSRPRRRGWSARACGRGSPRRSRSSWSRASPACGCPSRPTRRPGRRSRC